MEKLICQDCGMVYGKLEDDYVRNNPNASDMYREQLYTRHRGEHHPEDDDVMVCPDCGEEIGRWDAEYVDRYPSGHERAREQAQNEHESFCSVRLEREWAEWKKTTIEVTHLKIKVETPRQVLFDLLSGGHNSYFNELPCPPDRSPEYWPWNDLSSMVDIQKTKDELEDLIQKGRTCRTIRMAWEYGIVLVAKDSATHQD